MLTAGTISPELLKLANDIAGWLRKARDEIEARNYGNADEAIESALSKLPWDNGEHFVWPELEARTS